MHRFFKTAILFGALGLVACANADEPESPDGRDEVALTGGKADDNLFGACGEEKVLDLLNDPQVTARELKEKGLHPRAADNIIEARNGRDGVAGTADDDEFESLVDVDDVFFVGRVAMSQLADMVDDLCVAPAPSETEVIFSPQPHDQSHLARVAELIDGAEDSVDIAMYSFSDAGIMDSIEDAIDRGVSVRMVFEPARDERDEGPGTTSARLEEMGVDVRYINKIMHHKYAIIDGPREVLSQNATDKGVLATGSGNWSNSAGTRYDENTVILFGNAELNMRFQREFNHMWAHSRDYNIGENHEFFESDTIDEGMIPDDPTVDAVFTSDNFRTFVSSVHGETFSMVRGRTAAADAIVEHINSAEESIWVASGHLRSRPISLALIDKAKSDPDIDIKVYLDGQEYVSEFVHDREVREQEECLEEAGNDQDDRDDCLNKSYHWSFDAAHTDNIDLRFKYYAYRWHFSYAVQMHHKYMIIDGETVLSGSYNYSHNAEVNTLENVIIYEKEGFPNLVAEFEENFLSIWDTGDGELDELVAEIESGNSFPIVFDSMALTWTEVRDLKRKIIDNCDEVNTADFRRHPERHHTCFK